MVAAKPIEQTHIQMERRGIKKGGSETIAAALKEAVTPTKQHCTASSSSLYLCIHGKGLFLPSKNCHCLRSFAVKDREWEASRGGGRPHANDANANLQANQNVVFFFFLHGGGGLSCTPSLPTCDQDVPRS